MVSYSQGLFTPYPRLWCFLLPSEGLHHEREKVVLFLCSEAVESLDSYKKSGLLPFCGVFLSPSEGLHHELR